MRRVFPFLFVITGLSLLIACSSTEIDARLSGVLGSDRSFPPDRTAWTSAPADAQIAHARALHQLLMTGNDGSVANWNATGGSGQIALDKLAPAHGTFCGAITEQITTGAGTSSVRDLVCWGEGWEYIRDPAIPILGPAFEEPGKVYTVKSGGTLAAVARRTKTKLSDLKFLNPGHPRRLPRGTKILLP